MRTRRWFGLAFGLVAALALGLFLANGKNLAQSAEEKAKDQPAPGKGQRAQEFIAAFNKGDAKAVASFWTPDGDYVDQVGRPYKGRAAIAKLYEKVFAAQKGGKLHITVLNARMVSSEVAVEDGLTEVTPADGGPPSVARFSAVLVKKDGVWYFESVRDMVAHPPSNSEFLEDLDWLIGAWTGESEKGESARASYSWAENQNFIVNTFATTLNGVPVVGGTQWIAWDAVDKQIRSWSFLSGGGFSEAVWTKDGARWLVKNKARTADGKQLNVTNVITRIDADHLTFQLTQMTVDGKPAPDASLVKMKRVKADRP